MKRTRASSKPDDTTILDALFEHLPDCIYFKDRQGRFLHASRFLAMRTGHKHPSELRGLTDRDIYTHEHAEQAAADEESVMRTGEPIVGKVEKETWPDGSVTWVTTSKVPLRDARGRIVGLFGSSRDITEEHSSAEQLAQAAAELRDRAESYERDIKLAGEIFSVFAGQLPASLSSAAGGARFDCAHYYRPADSLGGDFHLLLERPSGWHRLLLCDVMGHGVHAALVAVLLRSWAQTLASSSATPAGWLRQLNQQMLRAFRNADTPVTATAFACDIHAATGRMRYCSAGHPPPFLHRALAGTLTALDSATACGPGMGFVRRAQYRQGRMTLEIGDRVVLFTDGLTEARDAAGEEWGERALAEHIRHALPCSAPTLVQHILRGVAAHANGRPVEDDICLIVLQRARR